MGKASKLVQPATPVAKVWNYGLAVLPATALVQLYRLCPHCERYSTIRAWKSTGGNCVNAADGCTGHFSEFEKIALNDEVEKELDGAINCVLTIGSQHKIQWPQMLDTFKSYKPRASADPMKAARKLSVEQLEAILAEMRQK